MITIKKSSVAGVFGLISICLGIFFLNELYTIITSMGVVGIVYAVIFIMSTIYYLNYLVDIKNKHKIVNEVIKRMEDEYVGRGIHLSSEQKLKLKIHLEAKFINNNYIIQFFRI